MASGMAQIKNLIPPKIKNFIKFSIAFTMRFSYYGINWRGNLDNATFLSDGKHPTFFGYHDKTPFNADGGKILAMSLKNRSDTKPENECTPITLGYFAKNEAGYFDSNFVPFAVTTTWCWQQGCMLQWDPLKPNSRVFYNTFINGAYGSVLLDVEKGLIIKEYSQPIYSIDPKGQWATSLNFSRLGRLRPGYGYSLLPDSTDGIKWSKDEGLFVFSLDTGEIKLLVSLATLAESSGAPNSQHFINHATFSPDGNHILFFHNWLLENNKRNIQLCLYDFKEKKYVILEDKREVSHYCWRNSNEALVTTIDKSRKRRLTLYYANERSKTDVVALKGTDTHPMRSPLQDCLFIMDSYPDKRLDQHLYLFDLKNVQFKQLASIYSPFRFRGQVRCDLHPRWDRNGKNVVVDSAMDGTRKLILLPVTNYITT